jgi:hypothetical protein
MHSSAISRTTGRNESASPRGRSHSLFATASRPHVRLLERDAHALYVLATRGEAATIRRGDWHAGLSALHQTVGAELRQFVAVATKPVAARSCHSYWKRAAMRSSVNAHGDVRST